MHAQAKKRMAQRQQPSALPTIPIKQRNGKHGDDVYVYVPCVCVHMGMYMCCVRVHVYMCTCAHVRVCTCTCACVCVCTCMCVFCTCMCACAHVCIQCSYACILCVCVHIYVCVTTHIGCLPRLDLQEEMEKLLRHKKAYTHTRTHAYTCANPFTYAYTLAEIMSRSERSTRAQGTTGPASAATGCARVSICMSMSVCLYGSGYGYFLSHARTHTHFLTPMAAKKSAAKRQQLTAEAAKKKTLHVRLSTTRSSPLSHHAPPSSSITFLHNNLTLLSSFPLPFTLILSHTHSVWQSSTQRPGEQDHTITRSKKWRWTRAAPSILTYSKSFARRCHTRALSRWRGFSDQNCRLTHDSVNTSLQVHKHVLAFFYDSPPPRARTHTHHTRTARYDEFVKQLKYVAHKNKVKSDEHRSMLTKRLWHGTRTKPPMTLIRSREYTA